MYGKKIIGLGAVSSKKIDVFSIDKNGNMEYEFSGTKKSANQKLSAYLMSYYTKNFGGSKAIKNLKSFNNRYCQKIQCVDLRFQSFLAEHFKAVRLNGF